MSANALGLQDLVAAFGTPTAVVDRWGRIVCSNRAWQAVSDDMMPLFHFEADSAQSVLSIGAVLNGDSDEAIVHVDVEAGAEDGMARFAQVRTVPIGGGDEFFLATCTFLDDADVESSMLLDRDTVTGTPGIGLFSELASQALAMAARYPHFPAVLAVAVDGLDELEAHHGRSARREVLVALASRLRSGLRPSDTVSQVEHEQFYVLLPDVASADEAHDVAERLCADHTHPIRVGEERLSVTLRVGVAVADESTSAQALIASAGDALAHTAPVETPGVVDLTEATRPRIVVAGETPMQTQRRIGAHRKIDLREMKEEELISYFQPIFDVNDLHVVAGEALMRWRHPHYGVLSAGEFLGLAINSGMLATLTDQALVRAAETWADFHDQLGARPPKLFVNLSPEQLLSRVAVDRLYHLLVATGLPSSDVVVEVTEEAMATRFGEMIAVLNELRAQGLHVALDDFGSGYSSLGRLRHLPVDVIKVDQSMVRGLETDHRARQLLAAVSTMANELNVDCIVEGIETEGEATIVADLGFRFVQGYHFGRPAPAEDFVDLVRRRQIAPSQG